MTAFPVAVSASFVTVYQTSGAAGDDLVAAANNLVQLSELFVAQSRAIAISVKSSPNVRKEVSLPCCQFSFPQCNINLRFQVFRLVAQVLTL